MGERSQHYNHGFDEVHQSFYFKEPDAFFSSLNEIGLKDARIIELKQLFIDNLRAAIDVGSLPFLMAATSVQNSSYQRMAIAEVIRAHTEVGENESISKERDAEAREIARKKHEDFAKTYEGVNYLREGVMTELYSSLNEAKFRRAAEELLREMLVMIWGAFEILCSDLFRFILNNNPKLLLHINKTDKRLFSSSLSIDELLENDFNMAQKMGDFVLKDRGLDSLVVVRLVFKAIFPGDASLQRHLKDDRLWMLWHRRHVIVHRRGLIDSNYIKRTGDANEGIGARLLVPSGYIDPVITLVRDTSTHLLQAADNMF